MARIITSRHTVTRDGVLDTLLNVNTAFSQPTQTWKKRRHANHTKTSKYWMHIAVRQESLHSEGEVQRNAFIS